MVYNLTGISTNTTGLLSFMQGVNNVLLEGQLGVLILIGLTFILGSSFFFSTGDFKKSAMATSFILAIASIFLRMMSLVSDLALFITLILAALSIGFSYVSRDY
jgi:hypothetical protein